VVVLTAHTISRDVHPPILTWR